MTHEYIKLKKPFYIYDDENKKTLGIEVDGVKYEMEIDNNCYASLKRRERE